MSCQEELNPWKGQYQLVNNHLTQYWSWFHKNQWATLLTPMSSYEPTSYSHRCHSLIFLYLVCPKLKERLNYKVRQSGHNDSWPMLKHTLELWYSYPSSLTHLHGRNVAKMAVNLGLTKNRYLLIWTTVASDPTKYMQWQVIFIIRKGRLLLGKI